MTATLSSGLFQKPNERYSYNQLGDTSGRDRIHAPYESSAFRDHEVDNKLRGVSAQIADIYNDLKTSTIDEISRNMAQDPVSSLEKDKKPDLDTYLSGLKYLVNRLIKFHYSMREINDGRRDKIGLLADDPTPALQAEIKAGLRDQEKLKLLLDTSQIKIGHLEKKNQELIEQVRKLSAELQIEKGQLRSQVKNQSEQMRLLMEENKSLKRPATSITGGATRKFRGLSTTKDYLLMGDTLEKPIYETVQSVKSMNGGIDSLKMISTQMEQNKLHNLQTKHELKELRRKTEQEREKDMTGRQKDLLIARLTIQVQEREKDITRLKSDYDRIYQDLKKIKEKDADREWQESKKEVLSEKNPHMVEHWKQKVGEKDGQIATLRKQLRKYAINEKKVFIKEKAFELERAEYQDKMYDLQSKVTRLHDITDNLKKERQYTGKQYPKKRRETNLNKSQTSSDDNAETKNERAGFDNGSTMLAGMEGIGRTPKLASFDSKLGLSRVAKHNL